jgi:hypothetical protein
MRRISLCKACEVSRKGAWDEVSLHVSHGFAAVRGIAHQSVREEKPEIVKLRQSGKMNKMARHRSGGRVFAGARALAICEGQDFVCERG